MCSFETIEAGFPALPFDPDFANVVRRVYGLQAS